MRAADECHPLPDQLHPCSWFSWFCSNTDLSIKIRSQEDRCVSRRLRSLQRGNRFLRSRSIRSRSLNSLRFSCFRHPPLRFDSIFSNGYRSCSFLFPRSCDLGFPKSCDFGSSAKKNVALSSHDFQLREGSRLFCSSSRERRRERCNPKSGSRDPRLELSSQIQVIGFAADHPKKRMPFHSPQFRIPSFEVLVRNLLAELPCEARLHIFFRKCFRRFFDSICHAELSLRPRDV
jgi:hypothetical protein